MSFIWSGIQELTIIFNCFQIDAYSNNNCESVIDSIKVPMTIKEWPKMNSEQLNFF